MVLGSRAMALVLTMSMAAMGCSSGTPVADEPLTDAIPLTSLPTPPTTEAPVDRDPDGAELALPRVEAPEGALLFNVQGLDPDDVLVLRDQPTGLADATASLAGDAIEVAATGRSINRGEGDWWELVSPDGIAGWANARFLAPVVAQDYAPCAELDETWTGISERTETAGEAAGVTPQPPTENDSTDTPDPAAVEALIDSSNVDHVQFIYEAEIERDGCERVTIGLGTGYRIDDTFATVGKPANSVPQGVVVENRGDRIRVSLPTIRKVGVTSLQEDLNATGSTTGLSYVARAADGSDDLFVDIFVDEPVQVVARFESEPARIVLDARETPLNPRFMLGEPVVSDVVALRKSLVGSVGEPLEVEGFARPADGRLRVQIRTEPTRGAKPGSGDEVPVTFTNALGESFVEVASATIATTDWAEAWGAFNFTIEGLEAGAYELWLSGAGDDTPGLYHVFAVTDPSDG